MNTLSRALSFRSNVSKNIKKEEEKIKKKNKNKEIVILDEIDKILDTWEMPLYKAEQVYKNVGSFFGKPKFIVKTVEESVGLKDLYHSKHLYSQVLLSEHKKDFKFLHIWMVQIALKPATRLGLNNSAIIAVRDKRHNKFHDSLLGIVESSLCDGPIYFSCYPNYIVSLSDPTIYDSLCLDIKTDGFDLKSNSENIILTYRIFYKVMNSTCAGVINSSDKGDSTTLFITDVNKSNIIIPKTINWDTVKLPEKWILEEANDPVKQV